MRGLSPARRRRLLMGALLVGVCLPSAAAQDSAALPEYVVKAGFLYNFAKYVEWPADAFDNAASPIVVGIVGNDPFGEEIDKALKNKVVKERAFSVVRYRELADLKRCHILFIPKSERGRLQDILKQTETWPILTVGEDEGFAKAGGTVNILIEKEKPRLEVNPEAADKARLTINSKLLKLATIVRTSK